MKSRPEQFLYALRVRLAPLVAVPLTIVGGLGDLAGYVVGAVLAAGLHAALVAPPPRSAARLHRRRA